MDQLRHFGIKTRMIRGDTKSYNKYDENEHNVLFHENGKNVECTCGKKHATLREHAQHEMRECKKMKKYGGTE